MGILSLCSVLSACISTGDRDTLASLRNVSIEIKEEKIDASLEKAMQSYQKFLEETPESALTPEAIRRLPTSKSKRNTVPIPPMTRRQASRKRISANPIAARR